MLSLPTTLFRVPFVGVPFVEVPFVGVPLCTNSLVSSTFRRSIFRVHHLITNISGCYRLKRGGFVAVGGGVSLRRVSGLPDKRESFGVAVSFVSFAEHGLHMAPHELVHGDLQRQHPLLELPCGLLAPCRQTLGGLSAVNVIGTQLRDPINSKLTRSRRYFQHAHFIPIVGVGKRGEYELVHGDLPRKHPFGITLRFTGPVPADSRQ